MTTGNQRNASNRSSWLANVEREMRARYAIDLIDVGWSDEDIDRYFEYGDSACSFVAWYGDKYGLIPIDD